MPSQRKRIGFLPSEEVHEIIDEICRANEFSQSKVTGLLVEEALRSRGILSKSINLMGNKNFLFDDSLEKDAKSPNIKSSSKRDVLYINKNEFANNIKMMQEFIEFKYFKKIMEQNKDIID